jgi:hypothetical protein
MGGFRNATPKCEPQLGRRGLYAGVKGRSQLPDDDAALLWVLNLSDGRHRLLDIAERARMNADPIKRAADALATHGLLREAVRPTCCVAAAALSTTRPGAPVLLLLRTLSQWAADPTLE